MIDAEFVRNRLKELFSGESQEDVAKRLNTVQSTISKILSGQQSLSLDMAAIIADCYGVSLDWIVGNSSVKKPASPTGVMSYEEATLKTEQLIEMGALELKDKRDALYKMEDPLLRALVKKAITLKQTDPELYQQWVDAKLSLFADKPLLLSDAWTTDEMMPYVDSAVLETSWLDAYKKAVVFDEMIADAMTPDGPYER